MTATADDLARRLVESPLWRWMPGMRGRDRSVHGFRVRWAEPGKDGTVDYDPNPYTSGGLYGQKLDRAYAVPVLDDPATEGCLLRLLEEAVARLEDETEVRVWGRDVELRHFLPARGSSRLNLAFDGPCRGENLASAILTVEHAILAAGEVRDA